MLTTGSVFLILVLAVSIFVAIWYLVVSWRYKSYLSGYTYARASHVSGPGSTVNMKCDSGGKITVNRVMQICSDPDSSNYENDVTDPMGNGSNFYNPETTVDLTKKYEQLYNGTKSQSFTFQPETFPKGCSGTPQLIVNYTCSPDY